MLISSHTGTCEDMHPVHASFGEGRAVPYDFPDAHNYYIAKLNQGFPCMMAQSRQPNQRVIGLLLQISTAAFTSERLEKRVCLLVPAPHVTRLTLEGSCRVLIRQA
jgi:hypothetical protein